MPHRKPQPNQVHIIGGKWRRRKLRFADHPGLRPTIGRTRETLFNWLRPYLPGTRCLDLFAGSGILGFEALSQGASHVTFVDLAPQVVRTLGQQTELLACAAQCDLNCMDSRAFLKACDTSYDIAFLDPPFAQPQLALDSITQLAAHTEPPRWIYVETAAQVDLTIDAPYAPIKQTSAGKTRSHLLALQD